MTPHRRSLILFFISVVLQSTVTAGTANPLFESSLSFPTGISPTATAVGDLNEDGIPDIAAAAAGESVSFSTPGSRAGEVSLLLGRGDGTYEPATGLQAGHSPRSVTISDLNGDGHLDLAVANGGSGRSEEDTGSVVVLMGNGDGTFGDAVHYTAGCEPVAILSEDLNRDGFKDLVAANLRSAARAEQGTLSVFLNNGDGTFPGDTQFPAGAFPVALATADLDGNGSLDLAVANRGSPPSIVSPSTCAPGSLSIHLGEGDGTFFPGVSYLEGYSLTALALEDLDGAHGPDIVVSMCGCRNDVPADLAVLLGNGDATFSVSLKYSFPLDPILQERVGINSVALGDMDGDGSIDVLVSVANLLEDHVEGYGSSYYLPQTGLAILAGTGSGGLEPPQTIVYEGWPHNVEITDVNQDGHPDIVAADLILNTISTVPGKGNGAWFEPFNWETDGAVLGLAAADVNGDGIQDLISSNTAHLGEQGHNIQVFLGEGGGRHRLAWSHETAYGPSTAIPEDINRDGLTDFLFSTADGDLNIAVGLGDGTFAVRNMTTQEPIFTGGLGPVVADLNTDGLPDILTTRDGPDAAVLVFMQNAPGVFLPAQAFPVGHPEGDMPSSPVPCDLDGDGNLDLVVPSLFGPDLSVLIGKGDGTFAPQVLYPVGEEYHSTLISDFNLDNVPDVAVAHPYRGEISILLGLGDGTLGDPLIEEVSGNIVTLAAGDLDGDLASDLALIGIVDPDTENQESYVSVLRGRGDGTFLPPNELDRRRSRLWLGTLTLSDLNGDGALDLLESRGSPYFWAFLGLQGLGSDLNTYINRGDGTFTPPVAYSTGFGPSATLLTDVTGDGRPDLVAGGSININLIWSHFYMTMGSISVLPNLQGWYEPCQDQDGDGYGAVASQHCPHHQQDCNDSEASVYPGAPETCDEVDNQCPGDAGHRYIDEGCQFKRLAPGHQESLEQAPLFSWAAGPYSVFIPYVVLPFMGHYRVVSQWEEASYAEFGALEFLWNYYPDNTWIGWGLLAADPVTGAFQVTDTDWFQKGTP